MSTIEQGNMLQMEIIFYLQNYAQRWTGFANEYTEMIKTTLDIFLYKITY